MDENLDFWLGLLLFSLKREEEGVGKRGKGGKPKFMSGKAKINE